MPRKSILDRKRDKSNVDMRAYHGKLFLHRFGIVLRYVLLAAIVITLAVTLFSRLSTNTYENYSVVSEIKREDELNTKYTAYGKNIIRSNHDGISAINPKGEFVWSYTYNMQEPVIAVSGNAAACADRGGSQLVIFGESGMTGNVDTLLPVQQVTVADNGVTAAIVNDSSVTWIYIYDKEGKKLMDARCSLGDTGQPIALSLSPDASKLAVSFIQIAKGTVNTGIVFYNLGSVGDNFVDKLVSSKLFEDELVPTVRYLNSDTCVAVGESGLYWFNGAEIPELSKTTEVAGEIQSVVVSGGKTALITQGEEPDTNLVSLYNEKGSLSFEKSFTLSYTDVELGAKNLILFNERECLIYALNGAKRFEGKFDETISEMFETGSKTFTLIRSSGSENIRLE